MILQINNATVRFAADTILDGIQFEIRNKNEKIAIVGRNGCGKTTLLKLINGEVEITSIDGVNSGIVTTGNPTIGYLKQLTFDDTDISLDDEMKRIFAPIIKMQERMEELVELMNTRRYRENEVVDAMTRFNGSEALSEVSHDDLAEEYTELQDKFREAGGYFYRKEYDTMLRKFGFAEEDKYKKLSEFSGGQRTKLAFIKLLLSKPDILLLDEPTNHLDITTIEWLEGYLKNYPKALVVVSHDRMFLDKIVETVYEIEHNRIRRYKGNYSDFVKLKKEAYDKQMKDYIANEKEKERLANIAERFMGKPTKASMAKSKLKAIEHMDVIEAPDKYDNQSFRANFTPRIESGKDCLFVRDLIIGYDRPLTELSFDLKRGERLGIIGGNGIGKSTLLKTLVDDIPALSGGFVYGTNVEVGYFDQQMAQYTSDKTIIDDFWDEYPSLTQTEVRNCLGAFLFTGDDVFKDVKMLSGGEKVRLALAKIFKKQPNFLILDEPTNHMDIVGKETLESMLVNFEGTVLFVSHDRYFVNKVATKVMLMDTHAVKMYEFGYSQYEEEMQALSGDESAIGCVKGKVISGGETNADTKTFGLNEEDLKIDDTIMKIIGEADTKGRQSYLASKEAARISRKIKKIEDEIQKTEEAIEEKKSELAIPENASSYMKLQEIQNEIDELEVKLLELMGEWDELSSI